MKTVADLKRRVIVGARLELVSIETGGQAVASQFLNVPRYVVHVQGDSYAMARELGVKRGDWYWAMWPKRVDLTWDNDGEGFTYNLPAGDTVRHYRFVPS